MICQSWGTTETTQPTVGEATVEQQEKPVKFCEMEAASDVGSTGAPRPGASKIAYAATRVLKSLPD